jgi:HD-GYP domain-containing protein (c-di-GMP phosphodiesterase class II)
LYIASWLDKKMIRISAANISAGERLAYDVFDKDGQLLLLRGGLITSKAQAELIRQTGYRNPGPRKSATPFSALAKIADRLNAVEQDIVRGWDSGIWIKRITFLVNDFIEVADANPDVAFACIHLDIHNRYLLVHHLMAALVSSRLALAKGLDPAERFSVVAAALTHDIGILSISNSINSADDLKDEDRLHVKQHPTDGVRMLREFGVEDPLWLETVQDHHEYLDGSGYSGKSGNEISLSSRILSLADSYSAMLRPRPYRDRIVAHKALELLYANELNRYDGSLLEALIWDLGFYPPGSLLRLANREMAVAICNKPGLLNSPTVAALTDPRGRPLSKPIFRDTQDPDFAIVDTLDPAMAARSGLMIEHCWTPHTSFLIHQ